MTVVPNGKNHLIPTRTVTAWRVCMGYRKLNSATCKDYFPMPFIDHMLDRLTGIMMSFGLCNAPATFQPYMVSIFSDMIEDFLEVFMDDFSVMVPFMVKEGIILDHKISEEGIEIDQAKIDVIAKLPPPISVKGVRSFLGACRLVATIQADVGANGFTVGAVLGQRHNKIMHPIYYASKMLNAA
ncbi:uncharacterized protein LOC132048896 [Lycium ferocissimum]|uniref:uncharacterized protein LOC132048896 n=1 Tax=Lycium ferocissimum TaxID=112874 RepID=UPI002814D46C|nr:uncharacterized protein LOC132048896 [Lycium ferocissimum]